jgi:hypothetical protein
MAYVQPTTLAFEEIVTKVWWEQLVANLTDVAGQGSAYNTNTGYSIRAWVNSRYTVVGADHLKKDAILLSHESPYLYYRNHEYDAPDDDLGRTAVPVIVEAAEAGIGDPVSLTEYWSLDNDDGGWVEIENEVPWLVPGRQYIVRGAAYAFELDTLS